ncbi:MAG: aminotransferase class III [Verrucomicrobia bacterium]|nr:MAG: aminotransferase class III [Verrucomicrobiota bacterium]HIO02809.1 aminotransferase class III-fold pyridoxal phosphate-dependent enzyme [Alphaproteobacteria bacterium]
MISASQSLYERAKRLIPGGTQLLSKRPEIFAPGCWPAYYREAQGCEVIDLDGNRLLDMSIMGIGTCLLGYNDPDVSSAVISRIQSGSMSSLNNPEEVELAEALLEIHPWAEQVRYARTGGEAMAIAVRIARAHGKRNIVAICGYHGWHDWYLAANLSSTDSGGRLQDHLLPGLEPLGVPDGLIKTALPFRYNHLDELEAIVRQHPDQLAAVVMEPTRHDEPVPGFLEGVRKLCNQAEAVLVVDEITAGWRLHHGGAHLKYGLQPDIAVFGKALGNGHPIAAVIGKREVMEAAQSSFISSSYWTEGVGPAAALATLTKLKSVDVPGHLKTISGSLRGGLGDLAKRLGLNLRFSGHPAITVLSFEDPQASALQTLFTVRMLAHGILTGSGFYGSWAHREEHVDRFLEASGKVLPEIAQAVENGDVLERIPGGVKHSGFSRLT